MKAPLILAGAPWLLAALLCACGGGGGGGGSTPTSPSTAVNATKAPTGFGFSTFSAKTLTSTSLVQAVGGFTTTNSTKAYVKLWYLDAASQRQQVMFMSLAALRALDTSGGLPVQVPGGIAALQCEIYDAQSSMVGEVKL